MESKVLSETRLKRYIATLNKVAVLIAFFDVLAGSYFLANHLPYPACIFFAAALGFGLLLPWLNYVHCYYASRFLFSFFGVGAIFLLALYFGEQSYAHLVLFVAASHLFYMMSPQEYGLWVPAALMPVVAFGALKYFDFNLGEHVDPSLLAAHLSGIHVIMWLFTFSFLALMGYFFTTQEQRYEARLQDLIADLGEEIMSRQRAEKRLAKAKDQNDVLVAILCHDVVNSLVSLRYATDELSKAFEGPLGSEPSAKNLLLDMTANLQNITQLVVHVRKLAMVANGSLQLPIEPVCMEGIVDKIKKMFETRLKAKHISFECHSRLALEQTYIWAHEITVVHEVLANVLSNAIKFSYENSVIKMTIDADHEKVVISVRDYGIGVPPQNRPTFFDLKMKVSRSGTKGETGAGLGLSLLRSHVELLSGVVRCESSTPAESPDAHGTTIHLQFKRCDVDQKRQAGSNSSELQVCS